MRSVIAVTAGVLFLVSASFAASSVKLPDGFVVPENADLNGQTLYHTIAYSLNTLPRSADISRIATPSVKSSLSSLVGYSATKRAILAVVPEALASSESVSTVSDNAFPLFEMTRTLNTAVVRSGSSAALRDSVSSSARYIYKPRGILSMRDALESCGVSLAKTEDRFTYTLNGAEFDVNEIDDVAGAAATLCAQENNDQVTVVDFRSAYNYAVDHFGPDSPQVAAVVSTIKSAISLVKNEKLLFILATDSMFFIDQRYPNDDFVAVPPHLDAIVKGANEKITTSSDTAIFQITLWFTIFIVLVTATFAVLTCGVGIDIEKDTLLYQTTCLRGQPVL